MWFGVIFLFLAVGVATVPLSAKAARLGMRFARDGVVVPGRIVDIERTSKTVVDDDGNDTIQESSAPTVAYRTIDGREMRESAIFAVLRTMATRQGDEFVPNSQRGQWQGPSWEPGQTVQVRYLADEPERFHIEGNSRIRLLWFLPLTLSALAILIGLTLVLVVLL
ncbi:DUF3592 domain-containing protein [Nocardia sp. NPDC059240]|uniref:DUF3592 domain-containing protein n=1 Tax=Nocardia sp. NPDC059240 TaxID=3346786 RepID=UPI00369AD9C6